jgi:geranylgeranyl reductase family protein
MTSDNHHTVIIAGAGPSGITCAYLLHQKGIDCLLIDKAEFPREKLCGGGLTPKTYELLDRLFPNLRYEYFPVNEMEIFSQTKQITTFSLRKEIRIVIRKDFDNALFSTYQKAGGKYKTARLREIKENGKNIYLSLNDNTIVSCDILVGADGANSIVRRYLQPHYPKGILTVETKSNDRAIKKIQILFDEKARCFYGYVFPNKDGKAVGCSYEMTKIEVLNRKMQDWGFDDIRKKGAYIPYRSLNYLFHPRILLIGDAGSYVDSVTEEGIFYALKTGENAATAITRQIPFEVANQAIIKKIKKINRISSIFYNPLFHKFCLFIYAQKWLSPLLSRIADYYIRK